MNVMYVCNIYVHTYRSLIKMAAHAHAAAQGSRLLVFLVFLSLILQLEA